MSKIKKLDYYTYEADKFPISPLKEFIQNRSNHSLNENRRIRYAHPIDQKITNFLESIPLRTIFNSILNSMISLSSGQKHINSIHASAMSFPEIYKIVVECSRTLNIAIPRLLLHHGPLNASTTGTDDKCFIELSTVLSSLASNDELKFVIGHECGHIHNQHVSYRSLLIFIMQGMSKFPSMPLKIILGLLSPAIKLALNAWSRRSEITADRAGLLCCGDIRVAENSIIRLLVGFENQGNVDIEDLLDHLDVLEEERSQAMYSELLVTHPFIFKRIKALRLFASSQMYHDLIGLSPKSKNLLNDEQLNTKVEEIAGVFR